jgi:hypothetical protein
VPGEGQFGRRGEDPDPVVRAGDGGRQHERGLRQVHPVGKPLHGLGAQASTVQDDRDGVAAMPDAAEDIDLTKGAPHPTEYAIG